MNNLVIVASAFEGLETMEYLIGACFQLQLHTLAKQES